MKHSFFALLLSIFLIFNTNASNKRKRQLEVQPGMKGKLDYVGKNLNFEVLEIESENNCKFCHKIKCGIYEPEWLKLDLENWTYEARGETEHGALANYQGAILEFNGNKNPLETDLVVFEQMEGKVNYSGKELKFTVTNIRDENEFSLCHKLKYPIKENLQDEWVRLDLQNWSYLSYDEDKKCFYTGEITEADDVRNWKVGEDCEIYLERQEIWNPGKIIKKDGAKLTVSYYGQYKWIEKLKNEPNYMRIMELKNDSKYIRRMSTTNKKKSVLSNDVLKYEHEEKFVSDTFSSSLNATENNGLIKIKIGMKGKLSFDGLQPSFKVSQIKIDKKNQKTIYKVKYKRNKQEWLYLDLQNWTYSSLPDKYGERDEGIILEFDGQINPLLKNQTPKRTKDDLSTDEELSDDEKYDLSHFATAIKQEVTAKQEVTVKQETTKEQEYLL